MNEPIQKGNINGIIRAAPMIDCGPYYAINIVSATRYYFWGILVRAP